MSSKVRNDNSLKVRVVAKGFLQRQYLDFFETYSAVASISTIRLVVALAASFGLQLMVADVEQAYLQSSLKEELYIEIPDYFKRKPEFKGSDCLRLHKGLYGTKQAGRGWFEMLKGAILHAGLQEAPEDPCLYYRRGDDGNVNLVVCTVVDDLLGAGVDGAFESFLESLKGQGIDLDDGSIGIAQEFNGMRVTRISEHHYELDQEAYISEFERSYSRTHCWRPKTKTKSPLGPTLSKGLTQYTNPEDLTAADPTTLKAEERADRELLSDPKKKKEFNTRYLKLLGSLMWPAQVSRPDIAYAVSAAAEHAKDPWSRHLAALERTLSYLINTKEKRLIYDCSDCARQVNVAVFTDSDHASDEADRRSRSGVYLSVNGCPVYWTSRKQTHVADSTTAAESIAANKGMQHIQMHNGNLRAMGFDIKYPPLFSDNMATLGRITNDRPIAVGGAKNLKTIIAQTQEGARADCKDIWPTYVATDENVSDIFTKGHLSGANSEEKWGTLEALTRGHNATTAWIQDLITAYRPVGHHGKGPRILAIERVQPITDLRAYFKESSWGKVYDEAFVKHLA